MAFFSKPTLVEEPAPPEIHEHRVAGQAAALVLLRGASRAPYESWRSSLDYLTRQPATADLDILSFDFAAELRLDLARLSTDRPALEKVALAFQRAATNRLGVYKKLTLVAHSLGGLVLQRALVDDDDLADRAEHVVLLATPSAGLAGAALPKVWMKRLRGLTSDGSLISDLGEAWKSRFPANPGFRLLAVVGGEDSVTAAASCLAPFSADQQAVAQGGHLDVVRPLEEGHSGPSIVARLLENDLEPAGPGNRARVAVELGDSATALEQLEKRRGGLDDVDLAYLAIALEAVGRRDEAVAALEERRGRGPSDALGILAARHKRQWLTTGREEEAATAHELYSLAKELALRAEDPQLAYRYAISLAFLELSRGGDRKHAMVQASLALHQIRRAEDRGWRTLLTQAEAYLYLGEPERALSKFRQALSAATPSEAEEILLGATTAAAHIGEMDFAERLHHLFRQG